jgi:hypothetical protein
MVDYYDIFRLKIGMYEASTPWSEDKIDALLNPSAYLISRKFATPWDSFATIPERYKYPVVLLAAIDYWWNKAGSFVEKADMSMGGGGIGQISTTMFGKAMEMIRQLQTELEDVNDALIEGSGDIILGDLVRRSKVTKNLVPYSTDIQGDWLS